MSRMNGWVRLYRKSLEHWLYNESRPHTRREAWEDMLLLANHADDKVMIEGELIECKRGQSVMSLKSWAKQFKWTIQQIRTFFKLLQNDKMITTEGLRKTTRVTICNYGIYQSEQQTDNTEITRRKHADNTEITTNKNVKNVKKEKNVLGWEKSESQYQGLNKSYPKLFLFTEPLTFDQHQKLLTKYNPKEVEIIYNEMQNYKELLKKSESAYLTATNWLNRKRK